MLIFIFKSTSCRLKEILLMTVKSVSYHNKCLFCQGKPPLYECASYMILIKWFKVIDTVWFLYFVLPKNFGSPTLSNCSAISFPLSIWPKMSKLPNKGKSVIPWINGNRHFWPHTHHTHKLDIIDHIKSCNWTIKMVHLNIRTTGHPFFVIGMYCTW